MHAMRFSAAFTLLLILALAAGAQAPGFLVGERENIVIFGDSITADGRYAQLVQNYIDAKFSARHIRVISAGSSGDTARGAQRRVETDVVPWRPAWVLINLGINDMGRFTVEEYLHAYEMLMLRIQRDTGAKLGIMSFIYPDHDNANREKESTYVAGLQALATKYQCLYIPCYETFQRIRPTLPKGVKYASDGIHAGPLGYEIFAQSILLALSYPFDGTPLSLNIPLHRLTVWENKDAEQLIGTTFPVSLPNPLQVAITAYQAPKAIAPRATGAMTIDGKLTDWARTHPILLDKPEMQSSGVIRWGYERRTSVAYACYDDAGWYFALEVQTPVVHNTPQSDGVARDCLELHLDLRTPEARAAAKDSLFLGNGTLRVGQLLFSPATADMPQGWIAMGSGDKQLLEGVVFASSLTNTGYILEIMLPAGHFPAQGLMPGRSYGLDISVDDVDRFSRWSELTMMRWSGSQFSFFSTIEFGAMTLGE